MEKKNIMLCNVSVIRDTSVMTPVSGVGLIMSCKPSVCCHASKKVAMMAVGAKRTVLWKYPSRGAIVAPVTIPGENLLNSFIWTIRLSLLWSAILAVY